MAVKPTETAWLYQPFESGLRAAVPAGTVGSVLSIRIVTLRLTVWSPAVAEHVCVVVPSLVTRWPGSQPVVDVMSAGFVIDHWIVTSLRNQPF